MLQPERANDGSPDRKFAGGLVPVWQYVFVADLPAGKAGFEAQPCQITRKFI